MRVETFSTTDLIPIKQTMLILAHKKVKSYISDLVYEFEKLDRFNRNNELIGKFVFLVRESGTEFGRETDERIVFEWGGNAVRYTVDFDEYFDRITGEEAVRYGTISDLFEIPDQKVFTEIK